MVLTLQEFRTKNPAYNDWSDQELAKGLHDKFYADMEFTEFSEQINYKPTPTIPQPETIAPIPPTVQPEEAEFKSFGVEESVVRPEKVEPTTEKPAILEAAAQIPKEIIGGVETGLNFMTSFVNFVGGQTIAGIAGLAVSAVKNDLEAGKKTIEYFQQALEPLLVYKPVTESGKRGANAIEKAFELLHKAGEIAGTKATEIVTPIAGEQLGAMAGTVVATLTELSPFFISPVFKTARGKLSRGEKLTPKEEKVIEKGIEEIGEKLEGDLAKPIEFKPEEVKELATQRKETIQREEIPKRPPEAKEEIVPETPGAKPVDEIVEVGAGLPIKQIQSFVDKVLVGKPRSQIDATTRAKVEKNFVDIEIERIRTSRFTKKLREKIPEKELEELIYYREKTGNPKIEDDTFKKLSERLSKEAKNIADREGGKRLDDSFSKLTEAGLLEESAYRDSYISHIYKTKGNIENIKKAFGAKFRTKIPFTKKRKIPTFYEAFKEHGLEARGNFADILEIYENMANQAIINNRLLKEVKELKIKTTVLENGKEITKPVSAIMRIDVARKKGIETGDINNWTPKEGKWAYIDTPALRRLQAVGKIETKGKEILLSQKVGVAIHPDVAYAMRQVFQNLNRSLHSIELINGLAKTAEVGFSFFHAFALVESSIATGKGMQALRPIKTIKDGLRRLDQDKGHQELMAKAGVNIGEAARKDLNVTKVNEFLSNLEKDLESIPGISQAYTGIFRLKQMNDKLLWDIMHRGFKSELFYQTYRKALKDFPNEHPDIVAKKVGSFINDAFGGQNWNTMWNVSPRMQQMARLFMFSADWTLSQIKVAGKALSGDPLTSKLHRRYMARIAFAYVAFHEMINYSITGHSTLENDPGHEGEVELPWKGEDGRKRYAHAGKQFREVIRWFTNGWEQAGNKMSPFVKEIFIQATGHTPGAGFPAEFASREGFDGVALRGKSVLKNFVPFSLSGSNLAFTLPMRKGTSFYRVTRDIARVLRSKPDLWNNPFQPTVERLLKAAKANGLDPLKVLMTAKGQVTRELYRDFFNAFESGDMKKADKMAQKISEYDLITEKGLTRSLSVKGLDKEQTQKAIEIFGKERFANRDEIIERYGIEVEKKRKKPESEKRFDRRFRGKAPSFPK